MKRCQPEHFAKKLESLLNVGVKETLFSFVRQERITRRKVSGLYLILVRPCKRVASTIYDTLADRETAFLLTTHDTPDFAMDYIASHAISET